MAESSFKYRALSEPFLRYLTVFRSRLGLANLVTGATTFGHQPERALTRRIKQVLEQQELVVLEDATNHYIFDYLIEKKIVGTNPRARGRYRGIVLKKDLGNTWSAESDGDHLERLSVYQTDIWLAHPAVPSTIGVPTPDNVNEVIDFAYQLHILDRSKNAWTTNAHLVDALRKLTQTVPADRANPFLLGGEGVALLRFLLERDGMFLRELLRWLGPLETVRRDDVAVALPELASSAVEAAIAAGASPQAVAAGRDLVREWAKIDPSAGSSAPGVLEHRSSPRLEWLVDLGYLTKQGFAKNEFRYRVTQGVNDLLRTLDSAIGDGGDWPFRVSLGEWSQNPGWATAKLTMQGDDLGLAVARAYQALRRPIGPAPLRDVTFIAGLLMNELPGSDLVDAVIDVARNTPGVNLSGGRMTYELENIFMSDQSLQALGLS
jgi:hypothetical protein